MEEEIIMEQYVGKFPKDVTKWLGFDKYEKVIYGARYFSESIQIVTQSIFGGDINVIGNWSHGKDVIDSTIGPKEFIGFISSPPDSERLLWNLEFLLLSIENKTLETYRPKLEGPGLDIRSWDECYLVHTSSFGWMVVAYYYETTRRLFQVEIEESTKTFSFVLMTESPRDRHGFIVIQENEIFLLSCQFNYWYNYDINNGSWSAKKNLFTETIVERPPLPYFNYETYVSGSDDKKHIILVPNYFDTTVIGVVKSCALCKLVENRWEKFFTFESVYLHKVVFHADGLFLTQGGENNYVVNTKVLSLRDVAFRKIFRQLIVCGKSTKEMKEILNLPTFLNSQYFAQI